MKEISLLAFAVCLSVCGMSQKKKGADPNIPLFGVVEKADLQMKECDFDTKAEAVVLLDDGQLEFINGKGMELKRRVRIKILNNKGLEWADVHLKFRSEQNAQNITGLEAQTYNLDAAGNVIITQVDKKSVYEKS